MKTSCKLSSLLFLFMTIANAQAPDELLGNWVLKIENSHHKVVTTLKIHFIEDGAESCLGGNWKKVIVDSYKTYAPQFFPTNEPLSYEFDGHKLAIGRNEICDAYLQLSGVLKKSTLTGEYIAFSWERQRLGYFSLRRSSK